MITRGIKHFASLAILCGLTAPSFLCMGQTSPAKVTDKFKPIEDQRAELPTTQRNADQTFELDFDERRFSETDFEASTALDTNGDSRGVRVRIGVSLTAGSIDVLLRGVRGRVRFRGSLDRIFEVIGKPAASSPEVR